MKPTLLSTTELKQYVQQISVSHIGIEGQERLKYSEVVINGITGISIIAMRCLMSSGIGCVKLVDNREVTRDMLPSQTLLTIKDIGKLRTIAVREKYARSDFHGDIEIINTKVNTTNIKNIMGSANILVETLHSMENTFKMIDLIEKNNLYLAMGYGVNWHGAYGTYGGFGTKKYKEQLKELFNRLNTSETSHSYFGFIATIIGGAIAGRVIHKLLYPTVTESPVLCEIDMLKFDITDCFNNNFK